MTHPCLSIMLLVSVDLIIDDTPMLILLLQELFLGNLHKQYVKLVNENELENNSC
jgi:hypothetical protein